MSAGGELPLGLVQAGEFRHSGYTYTNTSVLHRLVMAGEVETVRRRQVEITPEVVNMGCQRQGAKVLKKNLAGGKFVEITINIARCVATLLSIHKHVYRL